MSKETILLVALVALVIGFQIHSLPFAIPAVSSAAVAVSFELLGQTKQDGGTNPVFPETLRVFDGKKVTISGFTAPFNDPLDLSKLLLMPTSGGCYFCAPPNARGVVLIRRPSKEMNWWGGAPVTFEGVLHLTRPDVTDEEARQFLFTLDEARVVKASSGRHDF